MNQVHTRTLRMVLASSSLPLLVRDCPLIPRMLRQSLEHGGALNAGKMDCLASRQAGKLNNDRKDLKTR